VGVIFPYSVTKYLAPFEAIVVPQSWLAGAA
jgi:hypothetical protein